MTKGLKIVFIIFLVLVESNRHVVELTEHFC